MTDPVYVGAIDPGSRAAGWCVLAARGPSVELVAIETIRIAGEDLPARLEDLDKKLRRRMWPHHVRAIAVENGYVGENPKTSLIVGMARGVAIAAARVLTPDVRLIAPSTARLALGIRSGRRADVKGEVVRRICLLFGLHRAPSEDAADAAACAYWLAQLVGQPTPF